MARSPQPAAPAPTAAAPTPARRAPAATTMDGGLEAARTVTTHVLATACGVVAWMSQMHQLQVRSIVELHETLLAGLRESERAGDPQELMAAGTAMVNRQLALALRHFGMGVSQWVESDMQLAERLGGEVAAMTQQVLPGSVRAPASAGEGSTLKELGRLQDEWLSMTQRWIDAAGATVAH